MPYKEKPIEKKWYTIGEVAEEVGLPTSAIRFYEANPSWSDIAPKPRRTEDGNRKFTRDGVERLKLIRAYVEASHKEKFEAFVKTL